MPTTSQALILLHQEQELHQSRSDAGSESRTGHYPAPVKTYDFGVGKTQKRSLDNCIPAGNETHTGKLHRGHKSAQHFDSASKTVGWQDASGSTVDKETLYQHSHTLGERPLQWFKELEEELSQTVCAKLITLGFRPSTSELRTSYKSQIKRDNVANSSPTLVQVTTGHAQSYGANTGTDQRSQWDREMAKDIWSRTRSATFPGQSDIRFGREVPATGVVFDTKTGGRFQTDSPTPYRHSDDLESDEEEGEGEEEEGEEEDEEQGIRIKPSLYMRRDVPPSKPRALIFSLRDNEAESHQSVQRLLEEQTGFQIASLQYDPLPVRHGRPEIQSRWIVDFKHGFDAEQVYKKGLVVGKDKIVMFKHDDMINREVKSYKYFKSIQDAKKRLKSAKSVHQKGFKQPHGVPLRNAKSESNKRL